MKTGNCLSRIYCRGAAYHGPIGPYPLDDLTHPSPHSSIPLFKSFSPHKGRRFSLSPMPGDAVRANCASRLSLRVLNRPLKFFSRASCPGSALAPPKLQPLPPHFRRKTRIPRTPKNITFDSISFFRYSCTSYHAHLSLPPVLVSASPFF